MNKDYPEITDISEEVIILVRTAIEMEEQGEPHGAQSLASAVKGAKNQKVRDYYLYNLENYGTLEGRTFPFLLNIIEFSVEKGWLERVYDNDSFKSYIKATRKGKSFISNPEKILVKVSHSERGAVIQINQKPSANDPTKTKNKNSGKQKRNIKKESDPFWDNSRYFMSNYSSGINYSNNIDRSSKQQISEEYGYSENQHDPHGNIHDKVKTTDTTRVSIHKPTKDVVREHQTLPIIKEPANRTTPPSPQMQDSWSKKSPDETKISPNTKKWTVDEPKKNSRGGIIALIIFIIIVLFIILNSTDKKAKPVATKNPTVQTTQVLLPKPTKTVTTVKNTAVSLQPAESFFTPTPYISSEDSSTVMESSLLTQTLNSTFVPTRTENSSDTERIGRIIRDEGLYTKKDKNSDYVRTLPIGVTVKILQGPEPDANHLLWFQVVCEEFDKLNKGWVVFDAISLDNE